MIAVLYQFKILEGKMALVLIGLPAPVSWS